jgi:hypothetical protein
MLVRAVRGTYSLAGKLLRRRLVRRLLVAVLVLCAIPVIVHVGIRLGTRVESPAVVLPSPAAVRAWTRVQAGLREMYVEGSPEAIGASQGRLLRPQMIDVENQLFGDFEHYVPVSLARIAIEDLSRLRYRNVDRGIPEARRREIAAQAQAFQPDPFENHLPTYHRMVFLHALYDIALSVEHSPLIGCTSIAIDPAHTVDGHALVARAFDFEAGDVFDRDKVVFLVREDGAIPFASVAWAGLIGVVTGMNAEGVFLDVQGARGGQPATEGMPVVLSTRDTLSRAHNTEEAVAILSAQPVLVSHLVFVADAAGHFAVVERAPGVPAFVRDTRDSMALTNHFEGPLATDPKNLRVREKTSTVPRRQRADELVGRVAPHSARPEDVLAILRDHRCAGDATCALGDRRAIDAFIATHGVVGDTTARVLWVSAGPHLSGAFVRVDLRTLLAPGHDPSTDPEPETMPADTVVAMPHADSR